MLIFTMHKVVLAFIDVEVIFHLTYNPSQLKYSILIIPGFTTRKRPIARIALGV